MPVGSLYSSSCVGPTCGIKIDDCEILLLNTFMCRCRIAQQTQMWNNNATPNQANEANSIVSVFAEMFPSASPTEALPMAMKMSDVVRKLIHHHLEMGGLFCCSCC
jgi:hypothetical protein